MGSSQTGEAESSEGAAQGPLPALGGYHEAVPMASLVLMGFGAPCPTPPWDRVAGSKLAPPHLSVPRLCGRHLSPFTSRHSFCHVRQVSNTLPRYQRSSGRSSGLGVALLCTCQLDGA